jgi:hypothetical protein
LLPGKLAVSEYRPPYQHSIVIPLLSDRAEVDVTSAFQREGVDIERLILLTNGDWESKDVFVAPTSDGHEERMTAEEKDGRTKQYLGSFTDYVGTLIGEISFAAPEGIAGRHTVKFHAFVYLANENRYGIPKPVSAEYGTVFDVEKASYQKRVEISHELQPGQSDRFTVKVAVSQSSSHRFRATIRDIAGRTLQSLPIEMNCFVPRSRRLSIET